MKRVLLIIDMSNDFIYPEGAFYVQGSEKIIVRIKEEKEKARSESIPDIYLNNSHRKDRWHKK